MTGTAQEHHAGSADAVPFTAHSFPAEPTLQCDIVMKGGITSGVVYPLAVCELATRYRLRSVGGASAGAIAAAVAAAAEFGRRTAVPRQPSRPTDGPVGTEVEEAALPPGFLGLARFPDLLTKEQNDGRSLLFHLFRPQPEAERLFGLVTGAIERVSNVSTERTKRQLVGLGLVLGRGLIRRTRVRSFVGALLGLLLVAFAVAGLVTTAGTPGSGFTVAALVLAGLVGLLVAVVGMLAGAVSGVVSDLQALPEVGFGLTSGRGANDQELALTPWLHRRIQELAGLPYEEPLTMGQLAAEGLQLQVMTTNLNRAQPMVMPWDDRVYFYEPEEFRRLFGDAVVEVMARPENQPSPPVKAREADEWAGLLRCAGTKLPFPSRAGLPAIVATRMSLSFPLLISAVPLYAVDWTTESNQQFRKSVREWRATHRDLPADQMPASLGCPEFDLNWFSDGGLTSNLPVQFFDSALPTRPTFAIDLAPFAEGRTRSQDERENSYLPELNLAGLHRRSTPWKRTGLGQLVEFGSALINTARTWVDESSLVMPGYRDRVVTVYQDKVEGGLNLSMPDHVVKGLSLRGRFAAERLVHRFASSTEGWNNHRWVRLRTATAALNDWLAQLERGYGNDPAYYDALLCDDDGQPSYKISGGRLTAVRERLVGLRDEFEQWAQTPSDAFTKGRPQQPPALRLVPRTDVVGDPAPPAAGLGESPPATQVVDAAAVAAPEPIGEARP